MSEEKEMIVTLVDEDDVKFDASLIDSMEYDGRIYSFFVPVDQIDNEEQDVIVMQYTEEKDDVILLPVENEVLLNEIWDAYEELCEGEEN